MRFLTSIMWIIVLLIIVTFSINNWVPITVYLWKNLVMDTFLPVPLIVAFLAGMIPYFILHRATRWSMSRKLTQAERALAQTQASVVIPETAPVTS
ncbi:MAG: hypothetical protein RIS52_2352 [Pseudomonadota bacterium]